MNLRTMIEKFEKADDAEMDVMFMEETPRGSHALYVTESVDVTTIEEDGAEREVLVVWISPSGRAPTVVE